MGFLLIPTAHLWLKSKQLAMSDFKNRYYKKERLHNFVPHLKLKKVKQAPRTKFRQVLRSSIPFGQILNRPGIDMDIH
jgi:hypothetical protein